MKSGQEIPPDAPVGVGMEFTGDQQNQGLCLPHAGPDGTATSTGAVETLTGPSLANAAFLQEMARQAGALLLLLGWPRVHLLGP